LAQTAGSCRLSGLTNINMGHIEPASMRQQTVSGTVYISCNNMPDSSPVKYALMVDSNDNMDRIAAPSGFHKLWLNGLSGGVNQTNIPFNFYIPDSNTPWGSPTSMGVANGACITGIITTSPTIGPDGPSNVYDGKSAVSFDARTAPTLLDVPGGNYSAPFHMTIRGNSSPGISPDILCTGADNPYPGTVLGTGDFTVSVTAAASACSSATVNNIDFLKHYSLSDVAPAVGTVQVTCSAGVKYELGWDQGQHPTPGGGPRRMQCGDSSKCGGHTIDYDLYRNQSGTLPWGRQWNTGAVSDPVVSDGHPKLYNVYARIYPGQSTPPPGVYRDTVVATTLIMASP